MKNFNFLKPSLIYLNGDDLCLVDIESKNRYLISSFILLDTVEKLNNNRDLNQEDKETYSFLLENDLIGGYNLWKSINYWKNNNWLESGIFYFYTKDYPFLDYSDRNVAKKDREIMIKYEGEKRPPSIEKNYSNSEKYSLNTNFEINADLLDLFENNNYDLKSEEIDQDDISKILFYSFGKTGMRPFVHKNTDYFFLKCVPSGGSRHTSEAYLLLFEDIGNLKKGIYYYKPSEHSLYLIKKGDFNSYIENNIYSFEEFKNKNSKFIIFVSSNVERSMWRYRDSRSYRVILNDIGHIEANVELVSKSLGLDSRCRDWMSDEKIENLLNINYLEEPIIKYFVIFN